MFERVGSKIKKVAIVGTALGIVASILGGIAIMEETRSDAGMIVMLVGPFVYWLANLTLYGFGELVENSGIIVAHLQKNDTEIQKERGIASDEWKCPVCNRLNKKYLTTCICGQSQFKRPRADNTETLHHNSVTSPNAVGVSNQQVAPARADEWKCSVCGRVNRKYVTTCPCGQNQYSQVAHTAAMAQDTVTCPECGDIHTKGTIFCTGCGTKLN